MHAGDLILTPVGCWHDHGHSGKGPVVWLDALDLPLFVYLEGSYAIEAPLQTPRNRPDASEVEYRAAGLAPVRRRDRAAPAAYPMMRYPWDRTEAALRRLAEHNGDEAVELDYIAPETGQSCLPTMGFTAMMLRPGETRRPPLRSASAVFHVVSGRGASADQRRDARLGVPRILSPRRCSRAWSTRRRAANRPSWCASMRPLCKRSSATTRSAPDERDQSGFTTLRKITVLVRPKPHSPLAPVPGGSS